MNNAAIPEIVIGTSQEKLFFCFIDLRKEKPTGKISVTELCQRAGVNRSTFYRNYYDIFDLEEKFEEYCVNSILSFCVALNFLLDEDGNARQGDFEIPRFDNELVITAVCSLRHERPYLQKIYDRLLSFFPFLVPDGCPRENVEELKNVFRFILTGSIHLCNETTDESFANDIYSISKISCFVFSRFLKLAESNTRLEAFPIFEKETVNFETKKERLNVLKTKRILKRAFAALLKDKSVDKITVSELCEKAEICNSTFYTHYKSIDDFISKIKSKLMNDSLIIARNIYSQMGENMLKVKDLITYVDKNRALLLSISSNEGFCKKLFRYPKEFADSFYELIEKDYDCIFGGRLSFDYVCYCTWGVLFSPFEEIEPSASNVFKLAYALFMCLFRPKEKTEEVCE